MQYPQDVEHKSADEFSSRSSRSRPPSQDLYVLLWMREVEEASICPPVRSKFVMMLKSGDRNWETLVEAVSLGVGYVPI